MKPEEPSTLDDAVFKRVTGLVLNELAQAMPDQADRAAALLGLVVDEIAAIEDREDRPLTLIQGAGFALIALGAFLVFRG